MGHTPLLAGAKELEVPPSNSETEPPVRPTPNNISIFVLPVILPKTDRTDLKPTPLPKREIPTTGTSKGLILSLSGHRVVLKPLHVLLKPPTPFLGRRLPVASVHDPMIPPVSTPTTGHDESIR